MDNAAIFADVTRRNALRGANALPLVPAEYCSSLNSATFGNSAMHMLLSVRLSASRVWLNFAHNTGLISGTRWVVGGRSAI
jgi:hypothetical protein